MPVTGKHRATITGYIQNKDVVIAGIRQALQHQIGHYLLRDIGYGQDAGEVPAVRIFHQIYLILCA